jgi:hypothetical protein
MRPPFYADPGAGSAWRRLARLTALLAESPEGWILISEAERLRGLRPCAQHRKAINQSLNHRKGVHRFGLGPA